MKKTYQQILKKIHFDMHTPENILRVGDDLNVEEYVKAVKLSGAENVTIFARCGYGLTYFPTKYGVPHPNMHRDVFGEICTALRKENIEVTAYFSTSHIPVRQVEEGRAKLEWCKKDEDGKYFIEPIQDYKTFAPCPTGAFWEENMLPMILECAEKYDINGVWLDGLYGLTGKICHCERCKEKFLKDVPQAEGIDPSRPATQWRTDFIWDFLNKVGEGLENIRHGMAVGADVVACLQWSQQKPKNVGYITFDPQPTNMPFNISMNLASIGWRNVASDMNIERMKSWSDFNSRSIENLYTEAAICATMNSKILAGDILTPQTMQPNFEVMKTVSKMFDYGEKIYDFVKDVPLYADVAILSSPENARASQKNEWAIRPQVFESAYQCVISAGLTAHILFDDDLEENIDKYKMLILPELSYISHKASSKIKEFVENGGKLLVVGDIPKAVDPYELDEKAVKSSIDKLCGIKCESMSQDEFTYMDIKNTLAEKYLPNVSVTPMQIKGSSTLATATTATVESKLYNSGIKYQYGAYPIGDKTEYIAISSNNFGKGKAVFVATPIFKDYYDSGNFLTKRLIQGIINNNIKPYAQLTGSGMAQAIIAKNDNKVCASAILFYNDLRMNSPQVSDNVPKIADIKIIINDERVPKKVTSITGEIVNYTVQNSIITIEFKPFKIYNGVVIEF